METICLFFLDLRKVARYTDESTQQCLTRSISYTLNKNNPFHIKVIEWLSVCACLSVWIFTVKLLIAFIEIFKIFGLPWI